MKREALIRSRLFLIILFVILICPCARAQKVKRDNYPWISIGDIKSCKADTFRIQGKVIDRYHCPPCPEGAPCKPCPGDHLTVVDTDGSSKQQQEIFTKNPDEFAKDAVYVFVLTLRNKAQPDSGTNLIAFEALKK